MLSWADGIRRQAWESGLTCAGFATVIFSLSALQVKLTGGRVPVLELCVIRSSISFCTSVSVGTVSKIKPLFGHRRHLPLLFLRGLFGTAAIACSYAALLNLPLGDAVTLSQLRPPMMAVMGYLLLNEPLGWLGAAGCLVSLAGATIVSHPPFLFGGHTEWSKQRLLGTLCGMAAPCFGAGTGYCIRRIQKQEPALVVALWFHIVTVSLLVWPLLAGWPQAAVMLAPRDAALLFGISCSSFCAQLLMTRAFQLLPAAKAASLNFLGVVYSHALGALVFGEKITLFTLAGGLLIFVGVLLVAYRARNPSPDSSSSSKAQGSSSNSSTDDAEAAVLLKAFEQQQQQQQHGPSYDTFSKGLDQMQQQQVANAGTPVTPAAMAVPQGVLTLPPPAGYPTDVELGVRQQQSSSHSSSGGTARPQDDVRGDEQQQQQQLQPLLSGVSSSSFSSSTGGSFTQPH